MPNTMTYCCFNCWGGYEYSKRQESDSTVSSVGVSQAYPEKMLLNV